MDGSAPGRRVVVLGGGFAGAYCAQALGPAVRRRGVELLLIDRNNYFVFSPLLAEAGTGSLEPRHVVVPIRAFVRCGDFRMAEVQDVDLSARAVTYRLVGREDPEEVRYDHLVLALGSVTRMPDVPGLRTHGHGFKGLGDAVALRDRVIRLLELANATADAAERSRLLRFVVVGANYSGIEVAGEFDEFIRRAALRYPRVAPSECSTVVLELADRILAPLGEDLSAFALRHLRKRGVDVRLGTTVTEVRREGVTLTTGQSLPTATVVWCAGVEPNPLIRRLDLPLDERGYVQCDRDLRVRGMDNVWAIGDAAVNLDAEGNAYPATAQHAVRQGAHLARNLDAVLAGRAATACDLATLGSLAALGCRTGVARVLGFRIAGFPAWFLWRTVYLLKMPRWSRRVRVALDWTVNLLFARDYVQLGVHERTPAADRRGSGL